MKKVKSFVIDRGKWINGHIMTIFGSDVDSALLEPDTGLMCCLGIYGKACGIPEKEMKGKGLPGNLQLKYRRPYDIFDGFLQLSMIAEDNDDVLMTDSGREACISAAFKEAGVAVTFKGKYADAINKVNRALRLEAESD